MRGKGRKKERKMVPGNRVNIIVGEGGSDIRYFNEVGRIYETDHIHKIDAKGKSLTYIKNRCLQQMKEMGPDDYLAVVIDVDDRTSETIMEMEEWCRKNNIGLFVSNPSIEVFLLMHYKDVSPNWTQSDLERELSSVLGHPYRKSEGIEPDEKMIEGAIARAEKVLPKGDNEMERVLERPGRTNAHRLIQKLRDLTSDRRREMLERRKKR